ncbi:2-hydroxychromene-2-carboxylate isomerase [Sulfitobacter delicatus]|uniref:2-hydroxychromene-2-carboxylate isomerase n=1 Tax=Sulfitobacter delicatus TaxID=218672 RepID=A0A1G7TQI6_9RHOB|nr:2-hydroxychromene-2-carboxylate isomerase [Sulfitobacter delicatus]SDG37558.1 2-hydroxychromene-2-carboxylate isomerase [Sulfitobacter delicatus]
MKIDFWFSIGSTYSYLTVMRLAEVAETSGVEFRWRPFNVRYVMIEQNNIPFKDKPVKSAYMWRDIERRAKRYSLTPQLPAPYPLPGLALANQIAIVGLENGWMEDYVRATYRRWFESGEAPGEEPNISSSLTEIGCDPREVLAAAQTQQAADDLQTATDEAMTLGVFGSPTFAVGQELFWGDDRLEDAIHWAKDNAS